MISVVCGVCCCNSIAIAKKQTLPVWYPVQSRQSRSFDSQKSLVRPRFHYKDKASKRTARLTLFSDVTSICSNLLTTRGVVLVARVLLTDVVRPAAISSPSSSPTRVERCMHQKTVRSKEKQCVVSRTYRAVVGLAVLQVPHRAARASLCPVTACMSRHIETCTPTILSIHKTPQNTGQYVLVYIASNCSFKSAPADSVDRAALWRRPGYSSRRNACCMLRISACLSCATDARSLRCERIGLAQGCEATTATMQCKQHRWRTLGFLFLTIDEESRSRCSSEDASIQGEGVRSRPPTAWARHPAASQSNNENTYNSTHKQTSTRPVDDNPSQ